MDIHSFGRTAREADRLYRRQVERAWQALVEHGQAADAGVRDLVRASWQRCVDQGVDPVTQRPVLRGASSSLEALREGNLELLRAFQNTWRVLGDIMTDTQSCLIIADATGTILDACGSPAVLDRGARDCVSPGYSWSERSGGTNAIGTAIALNSPAEVHSAEHLLSVAKIWSCSAAPVRDAVDGGLVGVVDVTSFGDSYQQHCLALAVTAAHQIEETLQSRELARSVQLLHWYQLQARQRAHQAVVVLDRKGRVLTANDLARALCMDGPLLERGRPLLQLRGEPWSTQHVAGLPPRTRVVALEPYAPRQREWEGGLLILEAVRASHRSPPPSVPAATAQDPLARLLGRHPALAEARRRAARMARATAPVLLTGEPGTGRAHLARALHEASPLAAGPLVVVHTRDIESESMQRELFGEHGTRGGKVEDADGGTLYVEDIATLGPAAQTGLLRLMQEQVTTRPGNPREIPVRVRLVAATRFNLADEVAAGRFRADLHARLKVLNLRLPPLRDRPEDLPLLAEHVLGQCERRHNLGSRRLSPALVEVLLALPWRDNVRELQHVLEAMYVLAEGELLTPADLPEDYAALAGTLHTGADTEPSQSISGLERVAIETELARHGDNLSAVARRLGISRSTLYRKMKRYGLALP